jgi:hypothetical protein
VAAMDKTHHESDRDLQSEGDPALDPNATVV